MLTFAIIACPSSISHVNKDAGDDHENGDVDDDGDGDDDVKYMEVESTLRRGDKAADGGMSRTNPLFNDGD